MKDCSISWFARMFSNCVCMLEMVIHFTYGGYLKHCYVTRSQALYLIWNTHLSEFRRRLICAKNEELIKAYTYYCLKWHKMNAIAYVPEDFNMRCKWKTSMYIHYKYLTYEKEKGRTWQFHTLISVSRVVFWSFYNSPRWFYFSNGK